MDLLGNNLSNQLKNINATAINIQPETGSNWCSISGLFIVAKRLLLAFRTYNGKDNLKSNKNFSDIVE